MNPRGLCIEILARVTATDAYLNLVLDSRLSEVELNDPRDRALVTELCYGTVRRQVGIDFALAGVADRKLESIEDRVLAALRLGAYQLFYTRIPRHAAVGETVNALKSLKLQRAAGFCNAVLRKLSALKSPPLPPEEQPLERLAIETSHPSWLVERWLRHFGEPAARRMLEADNQPPALVLRTNLARIGRSELLEQLREAGLEAKPTRLSPVGITLQGAGRVEELYGFAQGLWQVQDEAAQLVTLYAAISEGARVLDACAAPGGKACHLAERHEVLASDLHANKLRKIAAEAKRLGLSDRLSVTQHDATEPFDEEPPVDAVFVDAPCSGLGTLRRHPELRTRRAAADLARLASLQGRILERAQERVPPGGLLLYAVCSLEPEEGPDRVETFLRSHPDFTAEPPPGLAQSGWPAYQGYLRTLPGEDGLDGFFAARLRRLY